MEPECIFLRWEFTIYGFKTKLLLNNQDFKRINPKFPNQKRQDFFLSFLLLDISKFTNILQTWKYWKAGTNCLKFVGLPGSGRN